MAGGCEPGFRGAFLRSVERLGRRAVSWHCPSGTLGSEGAACNLDPMACGWADRACPSQIQPGGAELHARPAAQRAGAAEGRVPPAPGRSALGTLVRGRSRRPEFKFGLPAVRPGARASPRQVQSQRRACPRPAFLIPSQRRACPLRGDGHCGLLSTCPPVSLEQATLCLPCPFSL